MNVLPVNLYRPVLVVAQRGCNDNYNIQPVQPVDQDKQLPVVD